MEVDADYIPPVKLRKTTNEDDHNDLYCFECHDEGDVICCDSCPRVYHPKCLGLTTLPDGDWTCPECKITQSAFTMPNVSLNEFHNMLKYATRRMKSHPQGTPFMHPVDSKQMPEYLDYIIHPMDLETIEKNIDLRKYSSSDAFLADVKWITHNSVVFNGSQSKFTGVARALLKIARHEMNEIEICSECYLRSAQSLTLDWFAEPCSTPHTLCWAKMKGYQPWPAKVLRIVNDEVDVRFFGQHDRAWVPINNCFILSKEYPGLEKKKSNMNFEKSLSELQTHIDKLKTVYGNFNYAPVQTPLSKTKPFKFVSVIDDSVPPVYVTIGNNSTALRSSIKCVKQARSPLPQQTTEPTSSMKSSAKRPNENSQDTEESVKRARVSSLTVEETNTNPNRIVLRIRKPSEDLSSSRSETSNGSNSNHQIIVQMKEPLSTLKEDDENQLESQSANVFDIFNSTNQTSNLSPKDDEIPPELPENRSPSSSSLSSPPSLSIDTTQADVSPIDYVDPNAEDVRLSMNALLDAVDAVKSISEVRTVQPLLATKTTAAHTNESHPVQLPFAERRTTTKHPRKSRLQHRIITPQSKPPPMGNVPLPPLEQPVYERSNSPVSTNVPLRPLSISPASTDTLEDGLKSTTDDLAVSHRLVERTASIETLSVKSEPINNEERRQERSNPSQQQAPLVPSTTPSSSSAISTKSFLISPPANTSHHKTKTAVPPLSTPSTPSLPAMIPNSNNIFAPRTSTAVATAQKTSWSSAGPMPSATRQIPNTAHKRPAPPLYAPTAQRNSNTNASTMKIPPPTTLQPQSFDVFSINASAQRRPNGISHPTMNSSTPPLLPIRNPIRMPQFNNHPTRSPIEDHQTPGEIQTIIKTFNDKFQQLLTDFTVKIETALESNRVKYEKELEETRRTYRMSMNELRTITSM
ncbi:unnamed protein product [Adineta ricciae]|uniref:Protein kinase C-binding protein 1 n=1 Tax=Adineta ricciae TaxID=249248 RepID=A0A816F414_ADIRI|nr:unnamed protein product [Adineta ricciae]